MVYSYVNVLEWVRYNLASYILLFVSIMMSSSALFPLLSKVFMCHSFKPRHPLPHGRNSWASSPRAGPHHPGRHRQQGVASCRPIGGSVAPVQNMLRLLYEHQSLSLSPSLLTSSLSLSPISLPIDTKAVWSVPCLQYDASGALQHPCFTGRQCLVQCPTSEEDGHNTLHLCVFLVCLPKSGKALAAASRHNMLLRTACNSFFVFAVRHIHRGSARGATCSAAVGPSAAIGPVHWSLHSWYCLHEQVENRQW